MNEYSSVVTPGWQGFLAFAFLAVMLWLLMRNMVSRIRRMKFAEQDRLASLEAKAASEPSSTE